MRRSRIIVACLLGGLLAIAGVAWFQGYSPLSLFAKVLNTVRSAANPPGTLVVEVRTRSELRPGGAREAARSSFEDGGAEGSEWPSYNRTLDSQRFSPLSQLNTGNVHGLKALCSYDTGLRESFETGPIMVKGALIGTTGRDIFSIDPSNCKQNWRTHEDYNSLSPLLVNRGAAFFNGRLFRGTQDGRVLAYDFSTGKRLWSASIADPQRGETVPAAPIAWNGRVFVGVAGGDAKGVKGRIYALDAQTGNILWETYLIPKGRGDPSRGPAGVMPATAIESWQNSPDVPISGGGSWTSYTLDTDRGYLFIPCGNPSPDFAQHMREGANLYTNSIVVLDAETGSYIRHFPLSTNDWHDWDASNAPAVLTTRAGKHLLSFAPKNGHLYGYDLLTHELLYRQPVTRVENAEAPFSTSEGVHFCPGAVGGGEWNGVSYDPSTNLIFTGQTEWCTTVVLQTPAQVNDAKVGEAWLGHARRTPLDTFGSPDPHADWGGWLYATDADTGTWQWRAKSNYPILSGVTSTRGGLVFFGDVGGNLYALDASSGERLWSNKLKGAIGGGIITYNSRGVQRVAVAAGLTSILWPTEDATARIVIFGTDGGESSAEQFGAHAASRKAISQN